jgi:hypothetical protein
MAETTYFPRRLILAGAMISGVLLALAVHMLGVSFGLDLGGLWRSDSRDFMPAGAAVAWWLIAMVGSRVSRRWASAPSWRSAARTLRCAGLEPAPLPLRPGGAALWR